MAFKMVSPLKRKVKKVKAKGGGTKKFSKGSCVKVGRKKKR